MIQVSAVTKKFDHRGIAGLHQVTLNVPEGEVFALLGPNGSGKTTLFNAVLGSLPLDSGTVKVEGKSTLFRPDLEFDDMNVQKFLVSRVTMEIDDEKKIQLSRDLADIFEFTFQLRQKLSELSMGQRQKVLLAAHLIDRPTLLLLDEPFTHLDPHTRKDILASLFTYIRNQGTSLLWITHDLDEALRFSDRVGILNFGRLEQVGTPAEIVRAPKNLFVAQFLGFENFVTVKKSAEIWQTPWGPWKRDFPGEEAILVVPTDAWDFSPQGLPMKVLKQHLLQLAPAIQVEWQERPFEIRLKLGQSIPAQGTMVNLLARLEECFLLPL